MHTIEKALLSAINKHPKLPLVIAYSGGVDSQVLLHALAFLRYEVAKKSSQKLRLNHCFSNPVTVCHVNHGLSDNATIWQTFAKQACLQLKLPLKICKVNVQAKAQQSLEALARDARYQALHSIYQTPSLIITGHHRDDQAETFLLALKRGSGLKGLSAMASETIQGNDVLLRPLLNISRADIIDYAKSNGLSWVEDESNTDTRFDRNFIRNDILPILAKRWPSITTTINRSSEHCREGQLLLDELAADDLSLCEHNENSLTVKHLAQLSQKRFNNLIRYFLDKHHCLMPSTSQLSQLYVQLSADKDKNPAVKLGKNFLRRHKGVLYLTADFDDISRWSIDITLSEIDSNERKSIELPDNLGTIYIDKPIHTDTYESSQKIVSPTKDQKISVRFVHTNPICLPDYRKHSRSLKKVLQELNIPTWQRKRIPFLFYDDVLVAAIGFFVCQDYLPKSSKSQCSVLKKEIKNIIINWAH